ncbi:MAG: Wzz/FepE/Etk N-terminal domain-containing protein, partial [Aeromonas sp.]
MSEKTPVIPNQWVQGAAPASDEIDLRELVLVLWRQKVLILLVTLVFAAAGIGYALLAPQVWSAKGVIEKPKKIDMQPLRSLENQAKLVGLTDFPDDKTLYDQFINEFNAYDNQREFLSQSVLFKHTVEQDKLDPKAQRRWLRKWSQLISAVAVDKKGEIPGVTLQASSSDAAQALAMLNDYIGFIVAKQQSQLVKSLTGQRLNEVESLQTRIKLMKEDAQILLSREIENTERMMAVASAAGVERPLENYNNNERFPITLGTKAL